MIDSTDSGDVVDQCTAGPTELVVETDARGQAQKTPQDVLFDAGNGPGSVALEGEQVLAGPKVRLDALPDRGQVGPCAGLVLAAGTHDGGVEPADRTSDITAGVALVTQQGLASCAHTPGEQLEAHLTLVTFGRGERERS
jgi:hypothetical protein